MKFFLPGADDADTPDCGVIRDLPILEGELLSSEQFD